MKALLIDSTLCMGCRGCQVACKEWNDLPAEPTTFFAGPGYQNPSDLSPSTWTLITYYESNNNGKMAWSFGKLQCMHCVDPACVTACPVHALSKHEDGPVVYDPHICLGCRYCQLACPFNIPRFEWSKAIPEITKCNLCADRVAAGQETACSKACATDAIIFGDRDELIAEAEKRIAADPKRYVNHVFGKEEVGGTCVLHISSVPVSKLGHKQDVPLTAMSAGVAPAMKAIPWVLTGLGVGLGAVSWIVNRRTQVAQDEGGEA